MSAAAPSIKSQPVYHALEWDAAGVSHLLFVAADDRPLLERLLAAPPRGDLTVLVTDAAAADHLRASGSDAHTVVEDGLARGLEALESFLRTADMGLRLYLVGCEDAIWQAAGIAARYGMSSAEIRLFQTGTKARPVFCVHCRAMTRGVRTNLADCSGCGRTLFVRDHFSRRLGAYMGFQIDAEEPGVKPPVEVAYP
ncbi:MAG: hypothetical protein EBS23_05660 [Betaproteobacteria bacterium]|jgi:hypothetical protein|nr:hypothetical protein [Betaproteobacteria bacterium]